MSITDPAGQTTTQLQAQLAAANARADAAEEQLRQVHQAVRAFKEKRERVAQALRAREEQTLQAAPGVIGLDGHDAINISMSSEAWQSPDPALDERLNRYLENDLEPDRSREWMLES